jgi:hypothetical protein
MGGIDFRFSSYKGVVDYYTLVLLGFARFANALASRHLEPPRFLLSGCNAAGKIGETDAKIGFAVFM